MTLSALQAYDIERALIKGNKIGAIRIYREATGANLAESKREIEKILDRLKAGKPRHFKNHRVQPPGIEAHGPSRKFKNLRRFLVFDVIVIVGLAYYFIFRHDDLGEPQISHPPVNPKTASQPEQLSPPRTTKPPHSTERQVPAPTITQARGKRISLPTSVDVSHYSALLRASDTFESLYLAKVEDAAYLQRKRSRTSQGYDDSLLERKIKSARSDLSQQRQAPPGSDVIRIARVSTPPILDGELESTWANATRIIVDQNLGTTLYLQVSGEWLFIACDVPAERTHDGYDQFRFYLHAGLVENLVNERIHIGKGPGLTSIRETNFRWRGPPPKSDDERWKRYPISDWGLYRYAEGISSMSAAHRQYEAALHLGEAGLHAGAPFTIYVEIETDPLLNDAGKFLQRQYLGQIGDSHNPIWAVF